MATVIILACGVLCLLVLLLFRTCFILVTVQGQSMLPTLKPGDRVLVWRLWGSKKIVKDSLVIFQQPDEQAGNSAGSKIVIKRVVALGGERYVEPAEIDSHGVAAGIETERRIWDVPEGHIFVRGDNTDASRDSRHFGPLPRAAVCGVVLSQLKANPAARLEDRRVFMPELLAAGHVAPDVAVPTIDGNMFSLQDMRGQKVVLYFTAYHSVARQELPQVLQQAQILAQKGIRFVIVCDEKLERAQLMAKELSIGFPVLVAPRQQCSMYDAYRIQVTPLYYLLDEQGTIEAGGPPNHFSPPWRQLCLEE